jgi:hypothetical protein
MAVSFYAMAVADAPRFDQKTIAYFDVAFSFAVAQRRTATIDEAQVREQADAIVFVTQIWPDNIVEDVILKGLDCVGKSRQLLGSRSRQSGSVDNEAGNVIEVRMRDEKGIDERTRDMASIRGRT